MSTKKVQGKFYPLQHQEFLKLNQILTQSELAVYLWLKTNDPFGGKLVEADTQKIAEDLVISRRSVQRALVKLQQEGLIELIISKFKYCLKSQPTSQSLSNFEIKDDLQIATSMSSEDNKIVSATPGSPKRHQDRSNDSDVAKTTLMSPSLAETNSRKEFQFSKTNKTYIDFKDSLSESERESFFTFVRKQIQNFNQPINDLEAWLASQTKARQNRWEVYYQKFREERNSSYANSDRNSTISEAKQKAIARHQELLKRQNTQLHQHSESKTDTDKKLELKIKTDRLPHNSDSSINKFESQSKSVAQPLSKRTTQGCEDLHNWNVTTHFAKEAITGGLG